LVGIVRLLQSKRDLENVDTTSVTVLESQILKLI
jgi:hypothetical protein